MNNFIHSFLTKQINKKEKNIDSYNGKQCIVDNQLIITISHYIVSIDNNQNEMGGKHNHDIKFITSVIDLYHEIGDVMKYFIHDC